VFDTCITRAVSCVNHRRIDGTKSVIDVAALVFDDENIAKMLRHRISPSEVQQVFGKWPRFYENKIGARASHVMLGPTRGGRVLVVPIEPLGLDDLWRPVTAFEANPGQVSRYRKGK
jgi:hypothetical protein